MCFQSGNGWDKWWPHLVDLPCILDGWYPQPQKHRSAKMPWYPCSRWPKAWRKCASFGCLGPRKSMRAMPGTQLQDRIIIDYQYMIYVYIYMIYIVYVLSVSICFTIWISWRRKLFKCAPDWYHSRSRFQHQLLLGFFARPQSWSQRLAHNIEWAPPNLRWTNHQNVLFPSGGLVGTHGPCKPKTLSWMNPKLKGEGCCWHGLF